jgi:hypothetical protein
LLFSATLAASRSRPCPIFVIQHSLWRTRAAAARQAGCPRRRHSRAAEPPR